jgi:hypothetical protein
LALPFEETQKQIVHSKHLGLEGYSFLPWHLELHLIDLPSGDVHQVSLRAKRRLEKFLFWLS